MLPRLRILVPMPFVDFVLHSPQHLYLYALDFSLEINVIIIIVISFPLFLLFYFNGVISIFLLFSMA